jgi:integrase/recombinase XerD
MFDLINKRAFYRNIHLNAPLLEERLQYLQLLKERGNSLHTIKEAANYLLRIIELLPLKIKRIVSEQEIGAAADVWAKYQSNHPQKRQSFSNNSKERFIACASEWLKLIGYLEQPSNDVALIYKIFERRFALRRHLSVKATINSIVEAQGNSIVNFNQRLFF